MNSPLVSFIIPYFNAGSTIQETIDSIFNQSYLNFDIWIVNDGSTDQSSIDKLKDFEGINDINVLHIENAGPSVARNIAIKLSAAEYIVNLDADDLILKQTIQSALKEMKKDAKVGVVYGDISFFGGENFIRKQGEFILQNQLLWNQVAICCLIKKNVFETVGYFDEELSRLGLEDWEFWLRVGSSNWSFCKMDEIHFQVRVLKDSRTFEVANQNLEKIKKIVASKHIDLWVKNYEEIFYQKKMLLETPDYKIGMFVLKPYRFIKNRLKNAF